MMEKCAKVDGRVVKTKNRPLLEIGRDLDVTLDFVNSPRSITGSLIAGTHEIGEGGLHRIYVYARNNLNAREASETFIHEARHAVMRARGIAQKNQWAEFMARGRQFPFENDRRANAADRAKIWEVVKREYPHLPYHGGDL
jgi:hypothetical protein